VRGWAGKRQVPNVRHALQHNVGLGGAVVVSLLRKGFPEVPTAAPAARLGYNAATECRPVSEDDAARVRPAQAALSSPVFSSKL
jgi:sterol carrier protein 2